MAAGGVFGALSLVGQTAFAAEPATPPSAGEESGASWTNAPAVEAAAGKPPASAAEPRRDPQGRRGISPFWEELRKGDHAFLARDHERAFGHYRQATTLDPKNAEGHLRMAEAQIVLGQLLEARESLDAALRFAGENGVQRARASFLLADVAERRGAWDEALTAWRAYLALADAAPSSTSAEPAKRPTTKKAKSAPRAEAPRIYTRVAQERIARVEARKQALAENEEVRKRIAERLQEAEQSLQQSK